MTTLALRQGSPEWIEGRRALVTATDIPVLLGISPWKCEADLADEKLGRGTSADPPSVRMRIGSALEPFIADLWIEQTGKRLNRVHQMVRHPDYPWAAASPDGRVIGERRLVEFKRTSLRSRFADGIPQDVEAQVAWQLGCSGYPVADIAVLTDDALTIHEQEFDAALFADLLAVAEDFRRRLAEGGPFARDDDRVRRDFPTDDGTYIDPTPDLVAMVDSLREARAAKAAAESAEKTVASALRLVLGPASGIRGLLTAKRSADSTRVNWPAVASEYRALLEPLRSVAELDAVVSIHSETKQGPRVLRLSKGEPE